MKNHPKPSVMIEPLVETAKPAGIAPADNAKSGDPAAGEVYAMPASVAQERFWLLANLFPGSTAFHMPACVRLTGTISEKFLEKSFQILLDRHETLRTTFEVVNNELMQIISPTSIFSLPVEVVANIAEVDREARVQELVRGEAQKPFDLVRGPVMRARLFRLGIDDHVLVVTIHHILADGWSHKVLQLELWSAYEALTKNCEPQLAPLAIQYSDFAAWQRAWLVSAEAREHLEFWQKKLSGPLPVLDFPCDRAASNRLSSQGAIETLLLSENLARALKSVSKTENVTMFMLMLTCFGILLSQEAGQEDFIIGSPMANRRPETEGLIGPFAGPAALRLNFSGNPTLHEAIQRVRDVTLDALGHCELPFETLLKSLNVRSVQGRNPLFQFYFSYQAAFLQPRQMTQLTINPIPTFSLGTPFEMQCAIIERQEGIRIQLDYNPDLYDSTTIRKFLQKYESSLQAVVSKRDMPICDLAISSHQLPSKTALTSKRDYLAPRDSLEAELTQIWEAVLELPRIGVSDDFFYLGGHSLLAAQLLKRIQERLGKELSLASLLDAFTIEQQARLIRGDNGQANLREAATLGGLTSRIPLFYLGGDPTFRALSLRLSALHEFHSLGMQESVIQTLKDPHSLKCIAAYFVNAIRGRHPQGPYMLGGWCSHGLLALEVAQQLRAQGEEVALVVMMETANPVARMAYPKWKRFVSSMQLKLNLAQFEYAYLSELTGAQKLNYIVGRVARRARRTARSLREILGSGRSAVPKTALEVLYEAADRYQPEPYSGPVLLIRSNDKSFGFAQDLGLGWKDMFGDRLEIREVGGNHYSMCMGANVEALAREIDVDLKKAEKCSPPR